MLFGFFFNISFYQVNIDYLCQYLSEMRVFKSIFLIGFLLFGIYTLWMYFLEDKKKFEINYEVPFPVDKVFSQFQDLRKFTDWNEVFKLNNDDNLFIQYYYPYQGVGSSIKLLNKKDSINQVELYLKKLKPNRGIQYDLFLPENINSYKIQVFFKAKEANKTQLSWKIETPTIPYYKRAYNLFTKDFIQGKLNNSIAKLKDIMSGKIEKTLKIDELKTDSIFVENKPAQYLIGLEDAINYKKGEAYKNIQKNHQKLQDYLSISLQIKEDELGYPTLIYDNNDWDKKEYRYYYGISINKKQKIMDASFQPRLLDKNKYYSVYYKGSYEAKYKSIKNLFLKAQKDSVRFGKVSETFLTQPNKENKNAIKLSLQILD